MERDAKSGQTGRNLLEGREVGGSGVASFLQTEESPAAWMKSERPHENFMAAPDPDPGGRERT